MTLQTSPGGSSTVPRSVDVARLAGVSQKTVSRVVNDEPYVSAEVRRRVLDAAETLGYRPNNAARALAPGGPGRSAWSRWARLSTARPRCSWASNGPRGTWVTRFAW